MAVAGVSDLDDLYGRAAQERQVLGVGSEDSDRLGRVASDDGEGGVDGVLMAVEMMSTKEGGGFVGDLLGDVVNVDAAEERTISAGGFFGDLSPQVRALW
ncbi:hypothetical protein J7E98_17715 [Streptomyces sp. ISL-86]|nr:hypothetical protein [Streptomyces sp. ISL-86]